MQARSGVLPGSRVAVALRLAAIAALLAPTFGTVGCAAPEQLMRRIDQEHTTICRGLSDAVDGLDRVFGEPRVEDRERIARAKVGARLTLRKNDDPGYSIPISLRVPLPALERRANIFLEYDSVADASAGINEAASSLDRNKTLSATVLSRVAEQVHTGVHLDLTWEDGPQTGFRPFLRWETRPEPLRFAVEQQVYYLTNKGFGAKSIVELDRLLSDVSFIRLRTTVEGNQDTPGTDVEHVLIYRRPSQPCDVALSTEVGMTYNPYSGDPATQTPGDENDPDQSFAQLRVIGTIFRPWIEYEIVPALFHPWHRGDALEYGITFTLRIVAEHTLSGQAEP